MRCVRESNPPASPEALLFRAIRANRNFTPFRFCRDLNPDYWIQSPAYWPIILQNLGCLREWKLEEIMTNNSRFSSCINVIIKFIQKSTSYLGLNTMTKWYPFIPNCLRQLIFSSSWVRTSDLSVNSRALCQLSYRGFRAKALSSIMKMPAVGLEPTTTRLKVLRSTKLS